MSLPARHFLVELNDAVLVHRVATWISGWFQHSYAPMCYKVYPKARRTFHTRNSGSAKRQSSCVLCQSTIHGTGRCLTMTRAQQKLHAHACMHCKTTRSPTQIPLEIRSQMGFSCSQSRKIYRNPTLGQPHCMRLNALQQKHSLGQQIVRRSAVPACQK